MTDSVTREIELFGIKAQVPEHPRFYRCPIDYCWMFATGNQSGYPIEKLCRLPVDRFDFEAVCCIAIVWFFEKQQRVADGSADWVMRWTECVAQADAWRSILRKSQEAK